MKITLKDLRRVAAAARKYWFEGENKDYALCTGEYADLATGKDNNHGFIYKYYIHRVNHDYSYLMKNHFHDVYTWEKFDKAMNQIISRELWYSKLLFYCLKDKLHQDGASILDSIRLQIEDLLRDMREMVKQSVIWMAMGHSTPLITYHIRPHRKDAFVQFYLEKFLVWIGSTSDEVDKSVESFKEITEQAEVYRIDWTQQESETLCEKLIKHQMKLQDTQIFAECDAHIRWCVRSYNEDTNSFTNEYRFKAHLRMVIANGCFEDKYVYKCLQQNSNQKYINEIQTKYKAEFHRDLPSMKKLSALIYNILDKHFDLNADYMSKQIEEKREKSLQYEEIWKYVPFEKRHEPFVVEYLQQLQQWIIEAQTVRPKSTKVKDKIDVMKSLMLEAKKYASMEWKKDLETDCISPNEAEDKQHNIDCNNAMRNAKRSFEIWKEVRTNMNTNILNRDVRKLNTENCWWDQVVYDCFLKIKDQTKVASIESAMNQMQDELEDFRPIFKPIKTPKRK